MCMGVGPSTGTWEPTSGHILCRMVLPPSQSICWQQLLSKEWHPEVFYPILARMLAGLILCRFPKGNYAARNSWWQYPCPRRQRFTAPHHSAPPFFSCLPFCSVPWALVVMGLIQEFCLGLDISLVSAFSPAVHLSIDCCLWKREAVDSSQAFFGITGNPD